MLPAWIPTFTLTDRWHFAVLVLKWASLQRDADTDHAAAVIGRALDDRGRDWPAWAVIATASWIVRAIAIQHQQNQEQISEHLICVPDILGGAVDKFVDAIHSADSGQERERIDAMIQVYGAVHAIDAATVTVGVLSARLDGFGAIQRAADGAFASWTAAFRGVTP